MLALSCIIQMIVNVALLLEEGHQAKFDKLHNTNLAATLYLNQVLMKRIV